jgi:hypothetical protein
LRDNGRDIWRGQRRDHDGDFAYRRPFAAAYAATAANGEIYVLDPANYGSLTITGPVSIKGRGWAAIASERQRGDHHQCQHGRQGGSLHVQDSVIRNFTQDGIAFAPNSSATPLPAALPLFAGGLSLIGGLGGRRKNSPSQPGELYSRLECHL